MKKLISLLLLLLVPASALPADEDHWLTQRAETSDAVVVAQLDRVNYEYRRDFPVGGQAWFRPLQTWKSDRSLPGILMVHERGLSESECYFPRPLPWEERPRYLLFLVHDEDTGTWRGHPDGCALEVLVNDANRYAARWPQAGFGGDHGRGDDTLQARVEPMTFQGPNAIIDASDVLAHQRRERAERDFMRVEGETLIPTRGIELGDLRQLMRPGLQPEDGEPDAQRLEELRERMLPDGPGAGM